MGLCAGFVCSQPGMVWNIYQPHPSSGHGHGSFDQSLAYVVASVRDHEKLVGSFFTDTSQPTPIKDYRGTESMATRGVGFLCVDGRYPSGRTACAPASSPAEGWCMLHQKSLHRKPKN